jgi:O-antigen ligase
LLVALTGGSSRPDVLSLPILRPAAVLFLGYALIVATGSQLRDVKAPLAVIGSLMLLVLLQLVPLSAAIWSALPHRETVARASALAGMADVARPLSLDPGRTWNTFFALFVPLATVVLVAAQAPQRRRPALLAFIAVGLLSAALGLLQEVGGHRFQLYRIAHDNYPTGLFANKNHQSIMLLWLMLATSWWATTADSRRNSLASVGAAAALIVSLLPLLVLSGSRAGLLLSLPTLLLCGWLLLRASTTRNFLKRGRKARLIVGGAIVAAVTPVLLVFITLAVSSRRSALTRLFSVDSTEDLRWKYLPFIKQMALDYLPFGSGFGSFEKVFNAYEPAGMLTSRYMNQAHDDALQLVIEGGIPALIILVAGLAWIAVQLARLWSSKESRSRPLAVFIGGSIGLWLLASLADYPLRTPFAAMLFAGLTVHLALPSVRRRPDPGALASHPRWLEL